VIAAVVLAAGLARRMGRQKLLLQLQGKAVVRWAVERIIGHVEDVVIVTGFAAERVEERVPDLERRYEISGFPTLVVAAPDGRLIAKHEGYRGREALLEFLGSALLGPDLNF